jgi:hypothetical protein
VLLRPLAALALVCAASVPVNAETYWVSPTGAATWVNCVGATPLDGASACSLATMRAGSVAAGDTIYFRGGAYSYNTAATLISPSASGTEGGRITYRAYDAEVPIITNINAGTGFYAVLLSDRDYVTVRGLTFAEFPRGIDILNGSDYNEIAYVEMYRTAAFTATGVHISIRNGNSVGLPPSTHNWAHHNTLHGTWLPVSSNCAEGGDLIAIGQTGDNEDSNYNTIEYNTLYNAGHMGTENFTRFNVFRGNFVYNPGFKTYTANLTGTATGGSATALIDTTKDFSALGVMAGSFRYVHNLSEPGGGMAKRAVIASISTTTNPNDTLTFVEISAGGHPTPTFANGDSYSNGCAYFADTNPPGDGLYGHRAMHFDTQSGQRTVAFEDRLLIEGNRAGHASSNPGNDGAECMALSAGYSIARYNELFGCAGSGFYFKNGIVSSFNRVYNNTIAGNGRFLGTNNPSNPIQLDCIQFGSSSTFNVLKNNICNSNTGGDWDGSFPASWTAASNFLAADGDPLFGNLTLTDYSSTTLPDLDLQAGSAALNAGAHLTVAVGAGSSATALVVDDASYFQDGTWGSSLSDIQPDCIAVGVVGNTACIASIDYATETITLGSAISWSDGASVWLYKKSDGAIVLIGAAPDLGANEFGELSVSPVRLRRRP